MRAPVLVPLVALALSALPVISAHEGTTDLCVQPPAGSACVQEMTYGTEEDDCDEGSFAFQRHDTRAGFALPAGILQAHAGGAESCTRLEDSSGAYTQRADGVDASLYSPATGAGASFSWYSYETGTPHGTDEECTLHVGWSEPTRVSSGSRAEACPGGVAPPNPGWGHVLP